MPALCVESSAMLDVSEIRNDFPILSRTVHNKPLIYLDNAATTQLPTPVLDRLLEHYRRDNANVHRGAHSLSNRATAAYEAARETAARFIGAPDSHSLVFTSGATSAINTVALGMENSINPGDEIIVTQLEHNSNLLPWQRLCSRREAKLKIVPHDNGEIRVDDFAAALTQKTRFAALTHVSNLTGSVLPIDEMIASAHSRGVPVLIDGAQAMRHEHINVARLKCDFYCFSGHKMLAPAGIGVLYMRPDWREKLPPAFLGGGTVDSVSQDGFVLSAPPHRFEAGTPNVAGAVALAAAIDYIDAIGRADIAAHERSLINYTEEKLSEIEGAEIFGRPRKRSGVVSFSINEINAYDLASLLDKHGIAVRSGSHCAHLGLAGFPGRTALRVSPAFYNTHEEIETLVAAVQKSTSLLRKWKGA